MRVQYITYTGSYTIKYFDDARYSFTMSDLLTTTKGK